MEHGLKYITFYVQKHIAPLAMCYNLPLVRDKPLAAPIFVRLVYFVEDFNIWWCNITHSSNGEVGGRNFSI